MIFLVLIVGFIVRLINLNQSIWLDEAINILGVKQYSLIETITVYSLVDFHPPGYFVLLWIWTRIFGFSEISVRLPSVFFGVLTIYLIYHIGKNLFSHKIGLVSAILLALHPLHIYYSQEARPYAFAAFTVSLNFFCFLTFLQKKDKFSIWYLLSLLLVFSSDYLACISLLVQPILVLLRKDRKLVYFWIKHVAIAIFFWLWWFPLFFKQLTVGMTAAASLPAWKNIVGSPDIKSVALVFIKFIIGRISLDDKLLYTGLLLPVLAFYSFFLFHSIQVYRKSITLILWLIVPILLCWIVSFFVPILSYFRVLFALVPFILLLSLGVSTFKPSVQRFIYALMVLIFTSCSLVYLFNSHFHREDWKGLVQFVHHDTLPVFGQTSGPYAPYDYYDGGVTGMTASLAQMPAVSIQDVNSSELEKYQKLLLIDYLVDIADPDRLVHQQLENLGYKNTKTYDFRGVGFVYLYER
jgi:mannosyltransferase